MRILSDAPIIRANQFYANQGDIIATVVNEVSRCLILRLSRKLVVIHLPFVLPVHPEDECLPHTPLTIPCVQERFTMNQHIGGFLAAPSAWLGGSPCDKF